MKFISLLSDDMNPDTCIVSIKSHNAYGIVTRYTEALAHIKGANYRQIIREQNPGEATYHIYEIYPRPVGATLQIEYDDEVHRFSYRWDRIHEVEQDIISAQLEQKSAAAAALKRDLEMGIDLDA